MIGPGNYPPFLPAVQAVHALAAGNAVLLKPAPGTRSVASAFAKLARSAGLSSALLKILPESVEAVRSAIVRGVDKVIWLPSHAFDNHLVSGALLDPLGVCALLAIQWFAFMLDWGGSVVKRFGYEKGVANIYVIDRRGWILKQVTGSVSDDTEEELFREIDRALTVAYDR